MPAKYAALDREPLGFLARLFWSTAKAGREHARAGRRDQAMSSALALLQMEPSDYPPSIVRLIQDAIDGIYADLGIPQPLAAKRF